MTSFDTGLDRLRQAMAARVDEGELPGLVFAVARGDDVDVRSVGTMDPDGAGSDRPMARDTIFRITSMTKPVLAVLALMLVEDGLVTLAEPVDRLLPELADRRVLRHLDGPVDDTVPARRPITVEDLLTFRMGYGLITEPTFNPAYPIVEAADALRLTLAEPEPRTPYPPDEWIARFATLPLMHQPGERWQYNVGSLVLGVLVARAAGQRLDDVFAKRLFAPLGMVDTGFSIPVEQTHRLPGYYLTTDGAARPQRQDAAGPEEWSRPAVFPSGAAGLVSTVDDYLRFGRLLLNGGVHEGHRLLTEESVRRLTTDHLTPEQRATAGVLLSPKGWGYGVSVTDTGRYGWAGGYGTAWFNDPRSGVVAIALTQCTDFLFNGPYDEFEALVP